MPDCAAHYQFGQDVLDRLPQHLRSQAKAFQREYDTGLQGPDIFFFYQPYHSNPVAQYGIDRHHEPGAKMFLPLVEKVHRKAALAYLMGLVCHYTLDACCHPYVNRHSGDMAGHHRMEAAYDRHLLSQWKEPIPRHCLAHASGMDFEAMATLWPGISAATVRACARSKRFYTWLMDRRFLIEAVETVAGRRGDFSILTLPKEVPAHQREHIRQLDELYARAVELAPQRILLIYDAMGTSPAELPGFETTYGGEL